MSGEGKKFDGDKPRMDLIPPEAMFALAEILTYGARKYTLEIESEWHALFLVPTVEEVLVHTPKDGVVRVTRNICDTPTLTTPSGREKTEGLGKEDTPKRWMSWRLAEKMIPKLVQGINEQNGSGCSVSEDSQRIDTTNFAQRDAPCAGQPSTCTLTIVTKQGGFEVSFAPSAITDSGFWETTWKGLNERFGISRPQSQTGDRNWEQGMKWGRMFGAMMRHAWAWWMREDKDPETGRSHMWHVLCCAAMLVAYEQRGTGEDDRA